MMATMDSSRNSFTLLFHCNYNGELEHIEPTKLYLMIGKVARWNLPGERWSFPSYPSPRRSREAPGQSYSQCCHRPRRAISKGVRTRYFHTNKSKSTTVLSKPTTFHGLSESNTQRKTQESGTPVQQNTATARRLSFRQFNEGQTDSNTTNNE